MTTPRPIESSRLTGREEAIEQAKANARLIAAAPDMLAALRSALRCISACGEPKESGVETEVRKALALLDEHYGNRDALRANPVRALPSEARLLEALTPSGETKAAYIGEFKYQEVHFDIWARDNRHAHRPVDNRQRDNEGDHGPRRGAGNKQ